MPKMDEKKTHATEQHPLIRNLIPSDENLQKFLRRQKSTENFTMR